MANWITVTPYRDGSTDFVQKQRLVNLDLVESIVPYERAIHTFGSEKAMEDIGSRLVYPDETVLCVQEDIGVFERALLKG